MGKKGWACPKKSYYTYFTPSLKKRTVEAEGKQSYAKGGLKKLLVRWIWSQIKLYWWFQKEYAAEGIETKGASILYPSSVDHGENSEKKNLPSFEWLRN